MTVNSKVVFITGVNRGIGRGLAEAYLARPNHTVVGSVRNKADPKHGDLERLPAARGSKLLLVSIESASETDPKRAVEAIQAAGVHRLDLVIANAATSPPLPPLDDDMADAKEVEDVFRINTIAPILLFQAVKPLLEKSSAPAWVSVSSMVGSISRVKTRDGFSAVGAYGISKAALNWFTASIHVRNPWLTAFCVHPGLVQTDMGNAGARALGLEKAPITVAECTSKMLATIDQATRDGTSGKYINLVTGEETPY